MALYLDAKAPTEVVQRRWLVPVDADDSAASVSLSASGVTVDANNFEGNELVLTLSAGSAGATGTITATVTTAQSRVLVETLVIPIISTAARSRTVRDIVDFALRKVFGAGREANSASADDALERLQDMTDTWREGGADVGLPSPLTLATSLSIPAWVDKALKDNLIVALADLYGMDVSLVVVLDARRGLQQIKQKNMPDRREAVYY